MALPDSTPSHQTEVVSPRTKHQWRVTLLLHFERAVWFNLDSDCYNKMMPRILRFTSTIYLNANRRTVFGKDEAEILEAIEECDSIGAAAKKLEISHKFTWNCLVQLTKALRLLIVITRRGTTQYATKKGGGGTTLTPVA